MIKVIITADDFGISDRFDSAIIDLMKKWSLSSVSVMVKTLSKQKIKELIQFRNTISIGLHFEYIINSESDNNYGRIHKEIEKQNSKFIEIFWFSPAYINKHNREQSEIEIKVLCDFAINKDIPVRLHTRWEFFETYNKLYKWKLKITDEIYNLRSKIYWIEKFWKDIKVSKRWQNIFEIISHPWFFDKDYKSDIYGSKLNIERESDYKNTIKIADMLRKEWIQMISFIELI